MDDTIKQMLSGYQTALAAYKQKLGESHAKLMKAYDIYAKLCKKAELLNDAMTFYSDKEVSTSMADMSALLVELAQEKQDTSLATIPSVDQVAAAYHIAYEQLPMEMKKTRSVYERIFEIEKQSQNALTFLRTMADEKIFLKLSIMQQLEQLEGKKEEAQRNSNPVMVNYYEKMEAKIPNVMSIAELEYYANLESEIAIYQNWWDILLLNTSVTLLCNAIAGWLLTQSEDDREEVENAYRFIAYFYGIDMDELFAVPRFKDHVVKVISKSVNNSNSMESAEALISQFKNAIQACMNGRDPVKRGPAKNQTLILWEREAPLQALEEAYKTNVYKTL
ncbi:MAG TPA: hypothetical protein PL059_04240 [Spirochaetota bacterium]|nr:hypothetical protein [Spirochaetota bacterium]HOM08966.1 hypothetical protein [Spirochaetota bacterium]HPP48903.1 hypothetical protein [Spirochaetota bacterium]HXK65290.1 hypothetical protein [Spirochaetota bacterium]